MSDFILTRDQGSIHFISMHRPDKLHAMSEALVDELLEKSRVADADPAVSVIVISGEGRAFSAGAGLSGWDADNLTPVRERRRA